MRKIVPILVMLGLLTFGATPVRAASVKIECDLSHTNRDDPIVFPGQPGAAHQHEFFGNRSTNASSTYASMFGKATTCPFGGDTAGYWAPTLLNASGQRIAPRGMTVYYRDRPQESLPVTPFPPDFRMIAGAPRSGVWGFNCDGTALSPTVRISCAGQSSGHTFVRGTVIFPNCGKKDAAGNIVKDSPDHRSHVAYPISEGKGCPASHPVQAAAREGEHPLERDQLHQGRVRALVGSRCALLGGRLLAPLRLLEHVEPDGPREHGEDEAQRVGGCQRDPATHRGITSSPSR